MNRYYHVTAMKKYNIINKQNKQKAKRMSNDEHMNKKVKETPLYENLIDYAKQIKKTELTEKEIDECKFIDDMTKTSKSGSFVMTYAQFDILTKLSMYPKSKICSGMWKLQLHPKNAFICSCENIPNVIQMKLPFMTEHVPYFRMIFGPAFPVRWCEIAKKIESLKEKPLYVLFAFDNTNDTSTNEHWIHYLDTSENKEHHEKIFCGGGRIYCERVAQPCTISYEFKDDHDFYGAKLISVDDIKKYHSVMIYLKDPVGGIYVNDIYFCKDKETDHLKEINKLYGAQFYGESYNVFKKDY